VANEFSKSRRKNIRKETESGLTYRVIEKPSKGDKDEFVDVYHDAIRRNCVLSFYHFKRECFDKFYNVFPDNILLVKALYYGKVIAGEYVLYIRQNHSYTYQGQTTTICIWRIFFDMRLRCGALQTDMY
jgi:predicted N-acyltransferase